MNKSTLFLALAVVLLIFGLSSCGPAATSFPAPTALPVAQATASPAPTLLPPPTAAAAPSDVVQPARQYLSLHGADLNLSNPDQELAVVSIARDTGPYSATGMSYVRMQQQFRGLPVFGVQILVHLKGTPPAVISVFGATIRTPEVNTSPSISAASARKTALQGISMELIQERQGDAFSSNSPVLGIFIETPFTGKAGSPLLAYEITAYGYITYIDAQNGHILLQYDNLKTERSRETYTAGDSSSLPGTLLLTEKTTCTISNSTQTGGGKTSEADDACRVHTFARDIYDYFWTVHGRDSYDGHSASLISTVNYASSICPNAGWTGKQMFYCAGFTLSEDAAAHELTHAVADASVGLINLNQPGALSESYADFFAAMVDRSDWLIGEDLPNLGGCGAIRSLADPPACGSPDHMQNILNPQMTPCKGTTDAANGCIHFNSGIPNKAAWLLASGGLFHGVGVRGIGRLKVEHIYYLTLMRLTPGAQFADAARETQRACIDLIGQFGINRADCTQVENAFRAVGITK